MAPPTPVPLLSARPARLLACTALAAFAFGARCWLLEVWGSSLPRLDQWDGEALALLRPWLEGTYAWGQLFSAHNEHRPALTRLATLLLFNLGGTWSVWPQLLFNALLHAATAAGLALVFWPALDRLARVGFVAGLAALFASTAGWQNALWGFQSQVYFANVLILAAAAGLLAAPAASPRWWLGLVAAAFSLFSNASGLLGVVSIAALALIAAIATRPRPPAAWLGAGLLFGVVAAGLALRIEPAHHAGLHARSAGQFLAVFLRCLAWPWIDSPALGVVLPLPAVALAARRWRRRERLDAPEQIALALALFAVLSAAGVAYARGGGLVEARPLSRYQEHLLLGAAAQLFLVFRLGRELGRPARIAGAIWTGVLAGGLITLAALQLSINLPFLRAEDRANLQTIQSYLASGNAAVLDTDAVRRSLHPNPAVVREVLDAPSLRPLLPAAWKQPGASPAPPWLVRHGRLLAFLSAAALAAVLLLLLARRAAPG